jgi:hypothetical protein
LCQNEIIFYLFEIIIDLKKCGVAADDIQGQLLQLCCNTISHGEAKKGEFPVPSDGKGPAGGSEFGGNRRSDVMHGFFPPEGDP